MKQTNRGQRAWRVWGGVNFGDLSLLGSLICIWGKEEFEVMLDPAHRRTQPVNLASVATTGGNEL